MKLFIVALVLLALAVACSADAQEPTVIPATPLPGTTERLLQDFLDRPASTQTPERIFQDAVGNAGLAEGSEDQRDLERLAIEVRLMRGQIAKEADRITTLEQAITTLQRQIGTRLPRYGGGSVEDHIEDLRFELSDLETLINCLRYSTGC